MTHPRLLNGSNTNGRRRSGSYTSNNSLESMSSDEIALNEHALRDRPARVIFNSRYISAKQNHPAKHDDAFLGGRGKTGTGFCKPDRPSSGPRSEEFSQGNIKKGNNYIKAADSNSVNHYSNSVNHCESTFDKGRVAESSNEKLNNRQCNQYRQGRGNYHHNRKYRHGKSVNRSDSDQVVDSELSIKTRSAYADNSAANGYPDPDVFLMQNDIPSGRSDVVNDDTRNGCDGNKPCAAQSNFDITAPRSDSASNLSSKKKVSGNNNDRSGSVVDCVDGAKISSRKFSASFTPIDETQRQCVSACDSSPCLPEATGELMRRGTPNVWVERQEFRKSVEPRSKEEEEIMLQRAIQESKKEVIYEQQLLINSFNNSAAIGPQNQEWPISEFHSALSEEFDTANNRPPVGMEQLPCVPLDTVHSALVTNSQLSVSLCDNAVPLKSSDPRMGNYCDTSDLSACNPPSMVSAADVVCELSQIKDTSTAYCAVSTDAAKSANISTAANNGIKTAVYAIAASNGTSANNANTINATAIVAATNSYNRAANDSATAANIAGVNRASAENSTLAVHAAATNNVTNANNAAPRYEVTNTAVSPKFTDFNNSAAVALRSSCATLVAATASASTTAAQYGDATVAAIGAISATSVSTDVTAINTSVIATNAAVTAGFELGSSHVNTILQDLHISDPAIVGYHVNGPSMQSNVDVFNGYEFNCSSNQNHEGLHFGYDITCSNQNHDDFSFGYDSNTLSNSSCTALTSGNEINTSSVHNNAAYTAGDASNTSSISDNVALYVRYNANNYGNESNTALPVEYDINTSSSQRNAAPSVEYDNKSNLNQSNATQHVEYNTNSFTTPRNKSLSVVYDTGTSCIKSTTVISTGSVSALAYNNAASSAEYSNTICTIQGSTDLPAEGGNYTPNTQTDSYSMQNSAPISDRNAFCSSSIQCNAAFPDYRRNDITTSVADKSISTYQSISQEQHDCVEAVNKSASCEVKSGAPLLIVNWTVPSEIVAAEIKADKNNLEISKINGDDSEQLTSLELCAPSVPGYFVPEAQADEASDTNPAESSNTEDFSNNTDLDNNNNPDMSINIESETGNMPSPIMRHHPSYPVYPMPFYHPLNYPMSYYGMSIPHCPVPVPPQGPCVVVQYMLPPMPQDASYPRMMMVPAPMMRPGMLPPPDVFHPRGVVHPAAPFPGYPLPYYPAHQGMPLPPENRP